MLLVSGEPHAGERTWRNLLKSDANVDLVHFTILRPPEKQDGTPINELSLIAFPTRELFQQKIKEFDLIIFDRYANQSVLPLDLFRQHRALCPRRRRACSIAAGPGIRRQRVASRARRLAPIIPGSPDGRVIEEPYKRAHHRHRRAPSGHPRPAGLGAEPARLGRMAAHRRRAGPAALAADVRRRATGRCSSWSARRRAASRCCCPITPGSGRAATTTAARISTCCAASRTG